MDDRRTMNRRHIMFYSRIFNRKTGRLLGYLGNLTIEGAMIISETELPTEKDYSLRMDLPEDIYNKKVLNLDAKSVWCKPDIDPNFYNIGFKVFNVSEEDKAIIEKIIVDYGFNEDREG